MLHSGKALMLKQRANKIMWNSTSFIVFLLVVIGPLSSRLAPNFVAVLANLCPHCTSKLRMTWWEGSFRTEYLCFFCENCEGGNIFVPGLLCAARFTEDKIWYRAMVTGRYLHYATFLAEFQNYTFVYIFMLFVSHA